MTMRSIHEARESYAKSIADSAGIDNERLIAAFASVERENFLGDAPWMIFAGTLGTPMLTDDPRKLYQDVLVTLDGEKEINNGQPSLHALCIAACAPAAGETVVQVGAGTGYYSAILAKLVGPTGQVIAYEIETALAERARHNLRHFKHVTVIAASATEGIPPKADVIYCSAGASHPPPEWLDALSIGGRLVIPLTTDAGYGCMFLMTRRGQTSYAAKVIARVSFITCIGARDDAEGRSLAEAYLTLEDSAVKSLHRGTAPDDTVWFAGNGWWLSTAEPDFNALKGQHP